MFLKTIQYPRWGWLKMRKTIPWTMPLNKYLSKQKRNVATLLISINHTIVTCQDIANKYVCCTMQSLLESISLDTQSLPSLAGGNSIISSIRKHLIPLQIDCGIYLLGNKLVTHFHDYQVCCSYGKVLCFKRLSAASQ